MIKKAIRTGLQLGFSSTARNLYWVFSSNFISIILTFFTLIVVIANRIPKADNGIFLALFTLANLLSDLGEAGLGSALSSFVPPLIIAKKPAAAQQYVATAFRIELLIGVILLIILIPSSTLVSHILFANTPVINVIITAILTFTMVLQGYSTLALSAYQKFREVSVLNIFYSLIRLALLILVLLVFKLTIFSILVVYVLSSVLSWFYSLLFLKTGFMFTPSSKPDRNKLLHFSSFLALQKVFISLYSRLDVLMMVPLAGAVAAGVYGVASRFSLVYPLVISSLGQVLAPKFAEFAKGRDALGFFKNVTLVIGLLLISELLFYIGAPILMSVLVPKYPEAIPVFRGLLISLTGFIIATPFVSFLIYTLKKPFITTISSFIQLMIIFVANLLFIPRFKEFGPIIGIGISNAVMCVIAIAATWYFLRKDI